MTTALLLLFAAVWPHGDAYILHVGRTNVTMTSSTVGVESLPAVYKRLGEGSYLWVREGGQEYVTRDAELLGQAEALWAPAQALKPEERAIDEEERELDRRIDALENHRTTASAGELEKLRARYKVVSRRERELDEQSEAMERRIESDLKQLIDEAIRSGRMKRFR